MPCSALLRLIAFCQPCCDVALQEHVYYKAIQDDTPDILAELLKLEGAIQRYNPRLLAPASSAERSGRAYAIFTATTTLSHRSIGIFVIMPGCVQLRSILDLQAGPAVCELHL